MRQSNAYCAWNSFSLSSKRNYLTTASSGSLLSYYNYNNCKQPQICCEKTVIPSRLNFFYITMFPKGLRFTHIYDHMDDIKKVSYDFVDGKWFVCVDEALRMQLVFSGGGVLFGNERRLSSLIIYTGWVQRFWCRFDTLRSSTSGTCTCTAPWFWSSSSCSRDRSTSGRSSGRQRA